ncbi:hypothetical protein [Deinococcus sp.]|uniref:hypothetical protein n=1 Tax=Deinococcus sp. TaxID=47478 RepID=UPI0025DF1C75|nr:hypothetical protein [Deinococcus sp.]
MKSDRPLIWPVPLLLSALLGALLTSLLPHAGAAVPGAPSPPAEVIISASDMASTPYGLLGKWMLDEGGQPARWLGYQLEDRALREPVNVVLIDQAATTPQEATTRLLAAMSAAGYPARSGYSVGYRAVIGTQTYFQQPTGKDEAFSDGAWWRANNHGRLFGPAPLPGGGYLWTGAFSRERFTLISAMHHPYDSFRAARDNLVARLDAGGIFRRSAMFSMDNALNTPTLTTDDHDAQAVVLIAPRAPGF